MNQGKTAILVFANNAEKELISKSIRSASVFDLLNTETLKTVRKTGLPYYHYSEKEQIGKTFAERFTNAIKSVYDRGYDTVISIGNDTPHLSAHHILKAKHQLESSDYVLGPSTDGGFYLMGFKKTHFNKERLEALPWQTYKLRRHLNTELNQQSLSVVYLEILSDIDDPSDIDRVLESFKKLASKIRKLLIRIRNISIKIATTFKIFYSSTIFKLLYNKGSPVLLHI